MSNEKGFVTAGTEEYFVERETRIKEQIAEHQATVAAASNRFENLRAELVTKRNEIMERTAELRQLKDTLAVLSEDARSAAVELGALAVQGDTLTSDLALLLADPLAHAEKLAAEIHSIESQISAKTKGPKKEIEKLEAKLGRLKLRHSLAMKSYQPTTEDPNGGALPPGVDSDEAIAADLEGGPQGVI